MKISTISKITLCMLPIAAACIILYKVNPIGAVWMPKCAFYLITGYKCPACGGLRSLHAILHGHFIEAWMQNPMAIITIPLAFIIIWRSLQSEKYDYRVTKRWVYAYIVVFFLWWVLRNVIGV